MSMYEFYKHNEEEAIKKCDEYISKIKTTVEEFDNEYNNYTDLFNTLNAWMFYLNGYVSKVEKYGKYKRMNTIQEGKYTFEIVDKIPQGFQIWNISPIEGYIPICETLSPSSFQIDDKKLKCIKVDNIKRDKLRRAASCGIKTLKDCEQALNTKRTSQNAIYRKELAKVVIEIFREISE